MNIEKMHEWFNVLSDQYNEPYFIDSEVDSFINNGTIEFINDIVFKEYFNAPGQNEKGSQVLNSIESSIQGAEVLKNITVSGLQVSSDALGFISNESINDALSALTGEDDKILHVISLEQEKDNKETLISYVRNSDIPRFNQNVFKRPTADRPFYTIARGGLFVRPYDTYSTKITLVKYPREVSLEFLIDSDMPDFCHHKIISYAFSLSGIASRDEVFLQLQQATGNGTNRIKQ